MTTVAEALAQRQRQAVTPQQMLAERDRAFEWEAQRPPALDETTRTVPDTPPGYFVRNPRSEPQPSVAQDVGRNLQLGTQAAGQGLADIVGLPGDIAEMLLDVGATGLRAAGMDIPDGIGGSGRWVAGGDQIGDLVGSGVEAMFGDVLIDPADMTPDERIRYEAARFGTQGAVGGAIMTQAANSGMAPRRLSAPYTAPGSQARVVAGDTAAGVGSGVAMQAHEEAGSPGGPIAELLLGLGGGVGGSLALRGAEGAGRAVMNTADNYRDMPTSVIPPDPLTGMPASRRDFANAAQLRRDSYASEDEFAAGKENIEAYLAQFGSDGANPTTALIENVPSQLANERRARSQGSAPFIEADRAVSDRATGLVASTRPEGADPAAARTGAATVRDQRLGPLREQVVDTQNELTEEEALLADLRDVLMSRTGMQDQASRDLDRILVDQTEVPRRQYKNEPFDAARAQTAPSIPLRNVTDEAARITGEMDLAQPGRVPDTALPRSYEGPDTEMDDAALLMRQVFGDEPDVEIPELSPAGALRRRSDLVDSAEARSRAGRVNAAKDAEALKRALDEDIRAAAEAGAPGTEEIAEGLRRYAEDYAPFFRQGSVAPDFFKKVARDPKRGATPPEATANRFLIAGPNSAAAAKDVRRILEIAPDPAAGQAAVREYVMADAVSKGVVNPSTGQINENHLAAFMNARTGMFDQFPELRAQFDSLLGNVRAGNARASELAADLQRLTKESQLAERDFAKGALQLVIDAEPRKAVAGVFGRKDTVAAMREIVSGLPEGPARDGWKAAVSDYLIEKSKSASTAGSAAGNEALLQSKLSRLFDQNREALAEVFSPEEMASLQQANTLLDIMSRKGVQATQGSATAENVGGLRGVLAAFAEPVGFVTTLTRGALYGGSYERRTRLIAEQFPDANEAAIAILERARFDPELALHLSKFPTSDAQVYTWSQRLNRLLNLGAVADEDATAEAP